VELPPDVQAFATFLREKVLQPATRLEVDGDTWIFMALSNCLSFRESHSDAKSCTRSLFSVMHHRE
jgi:hypothetical protein